MKKNAVMLRGKAELSEKIIGGYSEIIAIQLSELETSLQEATQEQTKIESHVFRMISFIEEKERFLKVAHRSLSKESTAMIQSLISDAKDRVESHHAYLVILKNHSAEILSATKEIRKIRERIEFQKRRELAVRSLHTAESTKELGEFEPIADQMERIKQKTKHLTHSIDSLAELKRN